MNNDSFARNDYIVQSIPYRIREVPADDPHVEDCYGRWQGKTIYLCEDSPWEERLETLVHETGHIITEGRDEVDLTKEDDLRWYNMMLVDTLLRNGIISAD